MRVALSIVFVLALVAAPLNAGAAPIDKREVQARKDFAAGRYEQAAEVFAELFAQTGDPIHLRNIARCYQKLKRPLEAINSFQDYLRKASNVSATEREEIHGYIKEMEALQTAQRPAAPPPTPEPDKPAMLAPAPAPAPVATAPGPEAKIVVAPAPPPSDDTARSFRVAGITTGAAGVALIGTGLAFGIAAKSASDSVEAFWDPDKDRAGKSYETLQWVGYGLGAAALGTGMFLYLYGRASSEPKQTASWQVRTALGGKSGGMMIEARF